MCLVAHGGSQFLSVARGAKQRPRKNMKEKMCKYTCMYITRINLLISPMQRFLQQRNKQTAKAMKTYFIVILGSTTLMLLSLICATREPGLQKYLKSTLPFGTGSGALPSGKVSKKNCLPGREIYLKLWGTIRCWNKDFFCSTVGKFG